MQMNHFVLTLLVIILVAPATAAEGILINDVSRLNPTTVDSIVSIDAMQTVQDALTQARNEDKHVAIAGKRHSMGGQAFAPNAVILDMTSFNRVHGIDRENKIITVDSGVTWDQIIAAADEQGLGVQVMQAYTGFTVGGSMSVNVHESDPRFGPLVESVDSFRLLLANGSIVNVSRTENAELFSLVVGGYGLFGVILDTDLRLIENKVYVKSEQVVDYTQYLKTFRAETADPLVENVYARVSIVSGETFLRDVIVTTYTVDATADSRHLEFNPPEAGWFKKFAFSVSRTYDWGKRFRWYLQREHSDLVDPALISRNNLMHGDVRYLDYGSQTKTDILQEYFVPVDNLPTFIDALRSTIEENDANLLSATIRYLPANTETVLSYAPVESFGVVLYFNVPLDAEGQEKVAAWSRELTEASLALNGTYYLPYRLYATPEQLERAYPRIEEFFAAKQTYDPEGLFTNTFYETYAPSFTS